MKTTILLIVSILLIAFSASAEDRRMLGTNDKTVPKVGEYYDNTDHIYLELYTEGGWIIQYIDTNKDYECDYIVTWEKFVDPTYGVFYGGRGRSQCPK